jgi:hypothetical protein
MKLIIHLCIAPTSRMVELLIKDNNSFASFANIFTIVSYEASMKQLPSLSAYVKPTAVQCSRLTAEISLMCTNAVSIHEDDNRTRKKSNPLTSTWHNFALSKVMHGLECHVMSHVCTWAREAWYVLKVCLAQSDLHVFIRSLGLVFCSHPVLGARSYSL